jgi:hypothetical protein
MTWVLVLLYLNGGGAFSKYAAASIVAVPGFASSEACSKAGEEISRKLDTKWICVNTAPK